MAKKRRGAIGLEDVIVEEASDPLGDVVKLYKSNVLAALVVLLPIGGIGAGIIAYFLLVKGSISLFYLIPAGLLVLVSVTMIGMNLINVGRRLELRKRGVRYVRPGKVTNFLWGEIVDVEVERMDRKNYGAFSIITTSSDEYSSSDLQTNTSWEITIYAARKKRIFLGRCFMFLVKDPQELIRYLRKGARLD